METIKITGKDLDLHFSDDDNKKMVEVVVKNAEDASDGYHTFDELYDHRITLYIALCKAFYEDPQYQVGPKSEVWRSKFHSDGELCFGTGTQFVLGIGKEKGKQITYHIPIDRWDETDFAQTLEKAPEWDGHISDDVLNRLKSL